MRYEALGRFIVAAISYMITTALIGFVLAGFWVDLLTALPYCMWIAGGFLFSGLLLMDEDEVDDGQV